MLTALLLTAGALQSAPPPPPPVPPQFTVPADQGPQTVQVVGREFPVGGQSGWHTHPGVEIGMVVAGETEMRLADGTSRRFTAGQSFIIPRGAIHNGVNVGTVPVRLVVTYVVDSGKPVRSDVTPPPAQ